MFEPRPSAVARPRDGVPSESLGTRVWRVIGDPLECSIVVVAVLPLVAFVAAGVVLWGPLGYVACAVSLAYLRPLLRATRRRIFALPTAARAHVARVLTLIAIWGVIGSVPIAQVFLGGDLDAMAAPAIAAQQSGTENESDGMPKAIYGPSTDSPSYGWCQSVHEKLGEEVARPCYTQIGYLRLWQMPVALSTLVSITLLYAMFPLTVAWHIRSRPLRRPPPSSSRFAKEPA